MEYINLPDFKALATLKAVVELGSASRAANALYIGQPAVTKRLRTLDSSYGVPLMQHEGRKLKLTTAGEKVYAYARLVLELQASLLDDLASLRTGHNRLRLEVTFAIGEHILPDILMYFADTRPELHIESRLGYSRRIHTRLATGLADIALLELAPRHPDIKVEPWMQDELLLVCGPGHPLWNTDSIDISELDKQHYVLREAQSSIRNTLDKTLLDIGTRALKVDMEVGSTDTIIGLLQRGKQVSFLPQFALNTCLQRNSLRHIKVNGLIIARTLWIAYNHTNINSHGADAFIQLLKQISSDHLFAKQPPEPSVQG
ncbi:MAG TPA: LysR family transcriptional regulator [Gammaproteobacteria bacterium]|nr:LysR family transcriptional regulator [Gammaproteobacteria bacterium]